MPSVLIVDLPFKLQKKPRACKGAGFATKEMLPE